VPQVVAIVNQTAHSEFFKEVWVRISENPDELVASRLYYWVKDPQLQQIAQIPGGSIFEIIAENGAPIVGFEIHELKEKDFVFIAIRRLSGELIISGGNVTILAGYTFTVFTKKEAEDDCLRLLNKQLKKST
jgi:trk system potassium uptake protein TrkA